MPLRIRPVREIEENIPSFIGETSVLLPQSIMQNIIKEKSESFTKKAKVDKNFTNKSKELLMDIWDSRDLKIIQAQAMLKTKDILFRVPSKVSDYDVLRLVSDNLLINKGNRMVAFTDRGKVALGMSIMEQPNEFDKQKKKDKFVFSQYDNDTTIETDLMEYSPDQIQEIQTTIPDVEIDPQLKAYVAKQLGISEEVLDQLKETNPDQYTQYMNLMTS
jgi:hypothetical protein